MITFDSSILLSYYQSRSGAVLPTLGGATSLAAQAKVPTPPWSSLSTAAEPKDLVKSVLAGRKFVDESAATVDVKGASSDYQKLFALHQALDTLTEVANRADTKGVSSGEVTRLQAAFTRGVAEVSAYLDKAKLEDLRLTQGQAADKAKAEVGVAKTDATFTTRTVYSGAAGDEVPAFAGDVKFDISVKRLNTTYDVAIDLNEISGPRTMGAVVGLINDKLAEAGLRTRVATSRTVGEPKQIQVGSQTVTLPASADAWAFKFTGDTTEKLTFSAADTEPAIYLGQTVGDPDPDGKSTTDDGVTQQQLVKLQTGDAGGAAPQLFGKTLPDGVQAIRQTLTGPDGAVYVLADVDAPVDGQTIKGARDVALQKYDSSGALVFTRTLGASDSASGLALAVSADGQVAVAGSVRGALIEGKVGADAAKTDSFVTVYDAAGQETWTRREAARANDEATAVAFGDDGSVYVAGRAEGAISGTGAIGGWDGYLRSFSAAGVARGVTQFGTAGDDKISGLAVDGDSVIVAGMEGGHGVLRRFDVSGSTPSLTATRDIGGLGGGAIAGIAIDNGRLVVGGASGNGGLNAGLVTRGYTGGQDAFAATLSTDLAADAGDAVAFFGGSGNDKATAVSVSGGKVWLAGSTTEDLPGMPKIGKQDGFVVGLDVASGAVEWSKRLTGKDAFVAPTAIAVDATGTSALDKLGLPKGTVAYSDSQRLTAATAVRAGDQFQIRSRSGGLASTITIEEGDTLDTLATKVRRTLGFSVKVDIVSDATSRRLQISPLNDRNTAEILSGPAGRDALGALGLTPGLLRATKSVDGKMEPADGGAPIFGLKLSRDLAINSKENIKTALDALTFASAQVRAAYRELAGQNEPETTGPGKTGGVVPTYLTNQIANYQAALSRLTGGG